MNIFKSIAFVVLLLSLTNETVASLHEIQKSCLKSNNLCYQTASQLLSVYQENIRNEIHRKTKGYRLPSAPFALLHGYRTRHSVLLIHGLNDSAYFLKDVAQVLFEQGINVVTILLPGHGRTLRDIEEVSYQHWLSHMRWGLEITAMVGENLSVGGFSTGGLLATVAALESNTIKNLFLFAPALDFSGPANLGPRLALLTCLEAAKKITYKSDIPENPVKYALRSANALCQLDLLLRDTYLRLGYDFLKTTTKDFMTHLAARIKIPVFTVLTSDDRWINPESIFHFIKSLRGSQKTIMFSADPKPYRQYENLAQIILSNPTPHSSILLKSDGYIGRINDNFNYVEIGLRLFLEENFL